MIQRNKYLALGLYLFLSATFANNALCQETTEQIDRTVTVDREFQPVIESAGKINVSPEVYQPATEPVSVDYSNYNEPLNGSYELTPLGFAESRFQTVEPNKGFLSAGFGHVQTNLIFDYCLQEKNNRLDISARHLAGWGIKTMANTQLGLNFSHAFSSAILFFGVDATNVYFTRYGKYFSYTDMNSMAGNFSVKNYGGIQKTEKNAQWEIETRIGVRSKPNSDLSYCLQTGYEAFVMKPGMAEHIINTHADLEWTRDNHNVGAELEVQNHLYSADLTGYAWTPFYIARGDTVKNNHHAIKFEPYYAYVGNRFRIHAGVNLDFCIGKGKLILPSPNVSFEAQLTPDWLALYGGAKGDYQISSVREHFQYLRYLHPENEIATTNNRTWVPVDASLGFKIKPYKSLLIDLYAHFNLTKYMVFYLPDANGYFNLVGGDYNKWVIGAKAYYHYKDIVNVTLGGYYNIFNSLKNADGLTFHDDALYSLPKGHMLDMPSWGLQLRVDAKIDSKWSIYSDNIFNGGRYALNDAPTPKAVQLKPVIDLNVGVQYAFSKWMSAYLQLNNFIHRKHDIVYGYQSQGINFMLGFNYTF